MITTTVGVTERIGEIIMAGDQTEIMAMLHPTYPKCRDWILWMNLWMERFIQRRNQTLLVVKKMGLALLQKLLLLLVVKHQ